MHDLNDLSKYEIEGTWHIEAGKYMTLTLPNGNAGFIKLSDAAKLKKGGSAKAFKKLQKAMNAAIKYDPKHNVIGGIKDAQFF